MTPARTIPSCVRTERALLGSLLFDGRQARRLDGLLVPEDFYDGKHAPIYKAMQALGRRNLAIDLLTVADQMKLDGTLGYLAAVGSEAYLALLANESRGYEPVESYATILRRHADRRRLILFASTCLERGYSDETDFEAAYDDASRDLLEIGRRTAGSPALPLRKIMGRVVSDLEARYLAKKPITGVTSGFPALDALTAGWQPSDLILVAGRPSMGKTAFALQLAANASEGTEGIPVLIFSLEMSKESLTERLLSLQSRIDGQRLRTGLLQAIDWVHIQRGAGDLVARNVEIDDTAALTVGEIRARARHWRGRRDLFPDGTGPGLVIVDYLQLCGAARGGRDRSREQEVSEISSGLKALAKELGVPVVALSQLNRGLENRADKRPTMADLRESGALEQDADVILFLYRDEVYNRDTEKKGVAEVLIGKQRKGPTGFVELHFDGACTRFESLSSRDAA